MVENERQRGFEQRSFVDEAAKRYYQGGPAIDIGGGIIENRKQRGFDHWPGLFDPGAYRVLDLRTAEGVDVTGDAEQLPICTISIAFVIWIWTLEYVRRFWVVIREIERVLRPGGTLVASAPWTHPDHPAPVDYWRASPDALRFLCEDAGLAVLESEIVPLGEAGESVGSYVIARKPE